jgi:hypothetical protein
VRRLARAEGDSAKQRNNLATIRPSLLRVCVEVQIIILKLVMQPHGLPQSSLHKNFPFLESPIPYVVPYSPLSTSGEGILHANRYFRTLGLKVLFAETAYAPICLCVRWFDRLEFLDRYAHVGYRACRLTRQILLSPSEPTLEMPFLGISSWTRLVLPMKVSRCGIDAELQTLSRLFAKMTSLKSIHLILILSSDRGASDWEVVLQELHKLKFLDCVSFTMHYVFPWYGDLARLPTLTLPCGREYVPTISSNTVRFEGANLSKRVGLGDLKCLLNHTYDVHRQISTVGARTRFGHEHRIAELAD